MPSKEDIAKQSCQTAPVEALPDAEKVSLPEFLDGLPEEGQRELYAAFGQMEHFEGPLPPPSFFREYEKIAPGLVQKHVEHSMQQVEKQAAHRKRMEMVKSWNEIILKYLGLVAGVGLAIFIVVKAYELGMAGHDVPACALVAVIVAALVVLVLRKQPSTKESKE